MNCHFDDVDDTQKISTERIEWLSVLIKRTTIPLPHVRRMALIESIRSCCLYTELVDLFLNTTVDSPYLKEEKKGKIARILLSQRWSALPRLLGVYTMPFDTNSLSIPPNNKSFQDFRAMTLGIFGKSKKLRQLSWKRRRELGQDILALRSQDDILNFLYKSMENSEVLDIDTCSRIAEDVMDGQFHRLLLTNRFDCEDIPRRLVVMMETTTTTITTIDDNVDDNNAKRKSICPICFGVYMTSFSRNNNNSNGIDDDDEASNNNNKIHIKAAATLDSSRAGCESCIKTWIKKKLQTSSSSSLSMHLLLKDDDELRKNNSRIVYCPVTTSELTN